MRQAPLKVAALSISCLVLFVLCEIGLRFFPYNSGMVASHVDDTQPIYRFLADRDIQYSQDWDMKNGRVRHVNKDGFLSDIEYLPSSEKPLLAVVGDSYIEAVQVDWEDTVHGRLHAALSPDIRVYSFGAAYAGLAQYLSWAEYAQQTYQPEMLVINVVGNDFLQPLPSEGGVLTGGFLGMTFFEDTGDGTLVLKRTRRPRESWGRKLLRMSALVNYLYRNLHITHAPQRIQALATDLISPKQRADYVANTPSEVGADDLALAKREVDTFLELLPRMSGLSPDRIVVTIDGLRPELYAPEKLAEAQGAFAGVMTRYLVERGNALGFEIVPLEPHFIAKHRQTGEVFEFPFNGHWNAAGHAVMAEAVQSSRTYRRVFSSSSTSHPRTH